jgi:hypothetical protein
MMYIIYEILIIGDNIIEINDLIVTEYKMKYYSESYIIK